MQVDPWVGKIPWRSAWKPTPVFLPGAFHGQRSLVGYNPWTCKKLDMAEHTCSNNSKNWTVLGYRATVTKYHKPRFLKWQQFIFSLDVRSPKLRCWLRHAPEGRRRFLSPNFWYLLAPVGVLAWSLCTLISASVISRSSSLRVCSDCALFLNIQSY